VASRFPHETCQPRHHQSFLAASRPNPWCVSRPPRRWLQRQPAMWRERVHEGALACVRPHSYVKPLSLTLISI
jgi:hypothetical protein